MNAITATIAITITTPTQTPALKISPITSHPEKIKGNKVKTRTANLVFMIFFFEFLIFYCDGIPPLQ